MTQNISPSDAEMSGGVGEGGGVKLTHLESQIQQTLRDIIHEEITNKIYKR